jgi:hypothetical protein
MIDDLRRKFARQEYEYSLHAVDQSLLKRITRREIEEAVAGAQVIEDYPTDKYGPSCLLFGMTAASRPLHILCTYPTRQRVKIITVYEPDPDEWTESRMRRTT